MAGGEDESQDVIVDRLPLVLGRLIEVVSDRAILLIERIASSPSADRFALRDGREPGGRVTRNTRLRPLGESVGDDGTVYELGIVDLWCRSVDDLG